MAQVFSGLWPYGQSQARGFSVLEDSLSQVELWLLQNDVIQIDIPGWSQMHREPEAGSGPSLYQCCVFNDLDRYFLFRKFVHHLKLLTVSVNKNITVNR